MRQRIGAPGCPRPAVWKHLGSQLFGTKTYCSHFPPHQCSPISGHKTASDASFPDFKGTKCLNEDDKLTESAPAWQSLQQSS
eukprot:4032495-Amphidinium_carterae.1